MRRAKAYQNGEFITIMAAAAVTEETRHAYDWRCAEGACHCRMHWRQAVHGKSNTDPRPPTFVKNPGEKHLINCPGDIELIFHENIDYVTLKDGRVQVRINFPLGSDHSDRYPLRGYLTEEMRRAAENQRDVKPFSDIGKLAAFIEKNFESLDSEAAAEILVNYQGQTTEWHKLFKGSDDYASLYKRAKRAQEGSKAHIPPIAVIVRPDHETDKSKSGMNRFICSGQMAKVGRHTQQIIPTIVCDGRHDKTLSTKIEAWAAARATLIVTARPYYAGAESPSSRYGQHRISLMIHDASQIAAVDASYWKFLHNPRNQLTLFGNGPAL